MKILFYIVLAIVMTAWVGIWGAILVTILALLPPIQEIFKSSMQQSSDQRRLDNLSMTVHIMLIMVGYLLWKVH